MRLVFFASLVVSTALHAEAPEVIGWAPDGKYVAFIEHGVGEGSGFPWAKLTVLDVAKRKPVSAPVRLDLDKEGATEADAVKQVKQNAEAVRKRLKIDRWVPGKTIAHDERGELHEATGAPIGTLKLITNKANAKQQARECMEPFVAQRLKLTMYFMDDDKPFSLLDEKKTPSDRACVTECKLGPVYSQSKGALFLLECGIQGFEGPGTLYCPVAAKLPYGLDEDLPSH